MDKKGKNQVAVIAALLVAVVAMSVGFAATAYTQALNINGSKANVKAAKWSVHFVDSSYSETAGSVAATTHSLDNTTLTYDVTLTKPGDFYETTVNVTNDGTFDADLTSIVMSGLSEAQANYVTYTIDYNGTQYTQSNNAISGVTLAVNDTVPVKVRVEYITPADATALPSDDQAISLTATLNYTQKQ